MKDDIRKLIKLILAICVLQSCVQDDDYSVPEIFVEPINVDLNNVISIDVLWGEFEQALLNEAANLGIPSWNSNAIDELRQSLKITFDENEKYVEGFVISSDDDGNFFEELIIQDGASNPENGLRILIDDNPLYQTYQFGRKIYVKLKGLSIGYEGGVLSMGLRNGTRLDKISASQQGSHFLRDTIVENIAPLPISISGFNRNRTNLFVRLSDVQFNRNDVLGDDPLTFAAEPNDEFDGERTLESCESGFATILSTSTFSDFKSEVLPSGRGSVDGILTMDYFGEEFNIVINKASDIAFNSQERCDPEEFDCGTIEIVGANILFEEYFETQIVNEPISGNGWTNFIESGTVYWEAFFSEGGNASLGISARIGARDSGDDRSVGWLISPEIEFDTQDGETLTFKTSNSFADGSQLEVWLSNNWNGEVESIINANWSLLSAAYIVQKEDNFDSWISSGVVDLSCVVGNGHIAWKYVGSGNPAFDGTYELDEIEVRSYD